MSNTEKQIVVRTFPAGYTNATSNLAEKLNEGYVVVMVTVLQSRDGVQVADYILKKSSGD